MSQIITKRARLSRRTILKGFTAAGSGITVGLPPLVSMMNSHGTAYAAAKPIETRFVLWFNGNVKEAVKFYSCLLYTSPSPRD